MFWSYQSLFDSYLVHDRIDYASKIASADERLDERNCFLFFSLLYKSIKGSLFNVGSRFPNFLLKHDLVDVVGLTMHTIDRDNCVHSLSETTAPDESLDDSSADLLLALLQCDLIACSFDCERELNLGPK